MSEIFFNERYADFLNAPDETESDALGVLSSLFSQIELARKVNVPGVNVAELLILMAQVEVLFAQYKILKATASELYARYEIEKASFLKNLAASIDQAEPLSSEEAAEMIRIIGVKLLAHRYSLAQLAPAAVIMSIKKSKEFTPAHAEHVRRDLSSYRLVEISDKKNTTKAVATSIRMDDQLVDTLKTNQELNVVVVNAPPGSGKSTCLNNLELRLRLEGYEVVQVNFDKVIAEFFNLLQKETKLWSKVISEEFDSSFFNLEQVIKEYYPAEFKNKRVIVLIDTLGYRIDQMNYGLWMIRKLLRPLIEQDKAMVITIVPQPAVVEKAKTQRSSGTIDAKNAKIAKATLKQSQGAPTGAIIRHHDELSKKIVEAQDDAQFKNIFTTVDVRILKNVVPDDEIKQMKERLAYAILTRNILRIFNNWWFAFNLFREEEDEVHFQGKE